MKWLAEELRASGNEVKILVIGSTATCRGWQEVVNEVVSQVPAGADGVFVAHSGAGPLLAAVVDRAAVRSSSMVFVDAGIPALETNSPLMPEEYRKELELIAVDGLLPPWSEWFGPDVMASLVPDEMKRELIERELPRVPLNYFSGFVPPVQKWPTDQNGYVLLSVGYLEEAEEARRRGWPVVELLGGHLDLVTKAADVASAIVQTSSQG